MSNFVGLCTFCEIHGPTVVMITQPLQQGQEPGSDSNGIRSTATTDCSFNSQIESQLLLVDVNETSFYSQLSDKPPSSPSDNVIFGRQQLMHGFPPDFASRGCEGCWSLGQFREAIFSTSQDRQASYVSSQAGLGVTARHALTAAVKSISCEVLPSRTGSLLFSISPSHTFLSHTFFLKDKSARGLQRYFSIIVGSVERGHLIRSNATVSNSIERLIALLTNKCSINYSKETKRQSLKETELERAATKKGQKDVPSRNLAEMVDDDTVFLSLHREFATILSCLESWRGEQAVTGQPVKTSLVIDQQRILLLTTIFNDLPPPTGKWLLTCLLAGHAVGIKCRVTAAVGGTPREIGRRVAECLALVLPNNKERDAKIFANIVLAGSTDGAALPAACDDADNSSVVFPNQLTITSQPGSSRLVFSFNSSQVCLCGECRKCRTHVTSASVNKMARLVTCPGLQSFALHAKILTIVEGILQKARLWPKLGTVGERKTFLRGLELNASDANILDFFQLFL